MNRYEIRDKASGIITHMYEAEQPFPHTDAWGTPEHAEPIYNDDDTLKLDDQGNPLLQTVPASYEVIVTNISDEWALTDCHRKRTQLYPPEGDGLDALAKWVMSGDLTELKKWATNCFAVKAAVPKPIPPAEGP